MGPALKGALAARPDSPQQALGAWTRAPCSEGADGPEGLPRQQQPQAPEVKSRMGPLSGTARHWGGWAVHSARDKARSPRHVLLQRPALPFGNRARSHNTSLTSVPVDTLGRDFLGSPPCTLVTSLVGAQHCLPH